MRGKKILNFSTIAISFTVLMLAFVAVTPPVFAAHCTTTVTAPSSIQTAVDAASSGDVVCLDDSGGAFAQQVVFDSTDFGITLSAADGDSPVLDGSTLTGSTTISAIELLSGVIGVTIEGLEIRDFEGVGGSVFTSSDRSSGILAASGTTSDITIRNNNIHDNFWNGILVFSAGDFLHDNWKVEKNDVTDNGFVGIELTNTKDSEIVKNNVIDNFLHGILIQARNTIGSGVTPTVDNIVVKENNVKGTVISDGIRFLAFQGGPTFLPLSGATAKITSNCEVTKNNVQNNAAGIRLQAFNVGATVDSCLVEKNNVNDNTSSGIRLLASASGTTDSNDVLNNRANGNGGDGIAVSGDSNTIEDNKANDNGGDGIDVSGDNNTIEDNKANGNTGDGIICTGTGNTETGNKAKGNGGTDISCP